MYVYISLVVSNFFVMKINDSSVIVRRSGK